MTAVPPNRLKRTIDEEARLATMEVINPAGTKTILVEMTITTILLEPMEYPDMVNVSHCTVAVAGMTVTIQTLKPTLIDPVNKNIVEGAESKVVDQIMIRMHPPMDKPTAENLILTGGNLMNTVRDTGTMLEEDTDLGMGMARSKMRTGDMLRVMIVQALPTRAVSRIGDLATLMMAPGNLEERITRAGEGMTERMGWKG